MPGRSSQEKEAHRNPDGSVVSEVGFFRLRTVLTVEIWISFWRELQQLLFGSKLCEKVENLKPIF
jgi:hypothetical protein